ncbi:hypothetical protein [Pyrodictium abyssi]|uniref:Uncharacterized protein n=1 Tax=Pyrodictium abyssi TaxID=54256 RepID=A0ABM8J0K4_9CREN|nr:hypothetical protein PABY_19370 [Pyrodictium abyssi]
MLDEISTIKYRPKVIKLEIDLNSWGALIEDNPVRVIEKLKEAGYSVQTYRTFPSIPYMSLMQVIATLEDENNNDI